MWLASCEHSEVMGSPPFDGPPFARIILEQPSFKGEPWEALWARKGGCLKETQKEERLRRAQPLPAAFKEGVPHFTYEASRSSLTKPRTDLGDAHFAKPAAYTMNCCNTDCTGVLRHPGR